MANRRPEDDDIIDAEIVEEEPEAPAAAAPKPPKPAPDEPFVLTPVSEAIPEPPAEEEPAAPEPTTYPRRARKKGGGLGIVVLLLIGVLIAAVIWRKPLTDFYNRKVAPMLGGSSAPTGPAGDNTTR